MRDLTVRHAKVRKGVSQFLRISTCHSFSLPNHIHPFSFSQSLSLFPPLPRTSPINFLIPSALSISSLSLTLFLWVSLLLSHFSSPSLSNFLRLFHSHCYLLSLSPSLLPSSFSDLSRARRAPRTINHQPGRDCPSQNS